MKTGVYVALGVVLSSCSVFASTINYQGRVFTNQVPYNGQGYFKFVIHDGFNAIWANDDAAPANTNQPDASVELSVSNGLFSVDLGDVMLNGMTNMPLAALHQQNLRLRTWFAPDDAAFEALAPDVKLNVPGFGLINTEGAIIVGNGGSADFDNLADAIVASTNMMMNNTIILLPGIYGMGDPISIPDHPSPEILIYGWGDPSSIWVENNFGAVFDMGTGSNLKLANITIFGQPAITDGSSASYYTLNMDNCVIAGNDWFTGSPAMSLQNQGSVHLINCRVQNEHGSGVLIDGGARLEATQTLFESAYTNGAALRVTGGGYVDLTDCIFWASQTNAWRAIVFEDADQTWGNKFTGCDIFSKVMVSNSNCSITFKDSQIDGAVIKDIDYGDFEFDGCQISTQSPDEPGLLLQNLQQQTQILIKNGVLTSSTNSPALHCQDIYGRVAVERSDVEGYSGQALKIELTAGYTGQWSDVSFEYSRISNSEQSGFAAPAVALNNDSLNDAVVGCDLSYSSVIGSLDGISIISGLGEIQLQYSISEGVRYGIFAPGGEVEVSQSQVIGDGAGVVMTNGFLDVSDSLVAGGDDEDGAGLGVLAAGEIEMLVVRSTISGEGPDSNLDATGLQYDISSGNVWLMNSTVHGGGTAIQAKGGSLTVSSSSFVGASGTAMKLFTGTNSRFMNSSITTYADNGYDIVQLWDGDGISPMSEFYNCSIVGGALTNSIGLAGSQAAGTVGMANTVLSRGVNASVTINGPATSLGDGNFVLQ